MYIVAISVQATPVDDNSKYSSIYPTFAVHSAVKEFYDGNHLAHSITMIQFLAFESYFDLRNKNHYLFCVGINWHALHKFFVSQVFAWIWVGEERTTKSLHSNTLIAV